MASAPEIVALVVGMGMVAVVVGVGVVAVTLVLLLRKEAAAADAVHALAEGL